MNWGGTILGSLAGGGLGGLLGSGALGGGGSTAGGVMGGLAGGGLGALVGSGGMGLGGAATGASGAASALLPMLLAQKNKQQPGQQFTMPQQPVQYGATGPGYQNALAQALAQYQG